MKKLMLGVAVIINLTVSAQAVSTGSEDSAIQETKSKPLAFTGFAEAYYSYDFNKPTDNNRPPFLYSHNRHNEFNINLAYIKASYNAAMIRANIALAVGTYMNANYSAEPGVLKNVYEANVGAKISKTKNLWVDAGMFSSHIGFESAHSPACWSLTRSMSAENSPYFESGARITYTSNNHELLLSVLALNGWQRITRVDGNSLMSWGTQLQFVPDDRITLNYSTFFGTDKPDSARLFRTFHNLYAIIRFSQKFGLTTGFDIGTEEANKDDSQINVWFTPVAILRFKPVTDWAIALRAEYYHDEHGVIIPTGTTNGFKTFGASLNVDKTIGGHLLWRTEIRFFHSMDAIFSKGQAMKNDNSAITSSLALTF